MVNRKVKVWNGEEWSKVTVKQTGTDQELVAVKLSNGETLKCTPYHKFYIQQSYHSKTPVEKRANELKPDDKLIARKWDLPSSIKYRKSEEFKYAYTHGLFCGDGTTYDNYSKTEKYPKLYLYGEKKKLLEHVDYQSYTENVKQDRYDILLPKDMAKKFVVPINASLDDRLRWFEGYCDTDGTIAINGTNESVQIGSTEKEFLLNVRLMLQTLGVETKITKNKDARKEMMPDGHGGMKEYDCKATYRLLLSSYELYHLTTLGFSPKRLKFTVRKPQRDAGHFVTVKSVTKLDQKEDTYCFEEPKRHMGMFNGVLTGQCAEIVEYTSSR